MSLVLAPYEHDAGRYGQIKIHMSGSGDLLNPIFNFSLFILVSVDLLNELKILDLKSK